MAYDVRAPGRLQRVHKTLSKAGYAVQKSVFAVDLTDAERSQLVAKLRDIVAQSEDDLRFYLVPSELNGAWHGPLPFCISAFGSEAATFVQRLKRADNS